MFENLVLQPEYLSQQRVDTPATELHPLHPDVLSRQATINIGTIGHVAHGKSTVVKALSGVNTVRFQSELERNITIKLGYANAKVFKCPTCPRPRCFSSSSSSTEDHPPCSHCGTPTDLVRHVSFVDCPGHDVLMATMINGAAVMDAALLLVAGNETCPQPQTSEHLAAVDIMQLTNIIVLQNKIDLVKEDVARAQHKDIQHFMSGFTAKDAPIIPISAQHSYNIDVVCDYIYNKIPVPARDYLSPAKLIVIRSFDINRPGYEINQLCGGIAGGSLLRGLLRLGQKVEIRPGLVRKRDDGTYFCTPLRSTVTSLSAEENQLAYAVPGGLIGVGTDIDPSLTRQDRLVGQVLGDVGTLPEVFSEIEVEYTLLHRLLGVRSTSEHTTIDNLKSDEYLLLNIGSNSVGASVKSLDVIQEGDSIKRVALLALEQPVCTEEAERVAISRRLDNHWRLIGHSKVIGGSTIDIE